MAEAMSDEGREPISPERLAEIRKECGPRSIFVSGVSGDGLCVMANQLLDEVKRLRDELAEVTAQRDEWHRQNGLRRGERDDFRAQLRTELAITKALRQDKDELVMRAHHAEVERDRIRAVVEQIQANRDRLNTLTAAIDQQKDKLTTALQNDAAEQRTRAETAERELAELRERIGEPETVWGHQVRYDAGWVGDAVPQGSEAAARMAVEHMNTQVLNASARAVLMVHEVWHGETEWRVVGEQEVTDDGAH